MSLDARLPGVRPRADAAPGRAGEGPRGGEDIGGRDAAADFEALLGGLEETLAGEAAASAADGSKTPPAEPHEEAPAAAGGLLAALARIPDVAAVPVQIPMPADVRQVQAEPPPARTDSPPAAREAGRAALQALMALATPASPVPAEGGAGLAALAAQAAGSVRAGAAIDPAPAPLAASVVARETHFAPVSPSADLLPPADLLSAATQSALQAAPRGPAPARVAGAPDRSAAPAEAAAPAVPDTPVPQPAPAPAVPAAMLDSTASAVPVRMSAARSALPVQPDGATAEPAPDSAPTSQTAPVPGAGPALEAPPVAQVSSVEPRPTRPRPDAERAVLPTAGQTRPAVQAVEPGPARMRAEPDMPAPAAEAGRPAEPAAPAAPSLPAATLRQIAEAIAAEAPAPLAAPAHALPVPGQEGPLRLLTLQLRPAELGTVLVRMRLQDGRLEMNLQASREETAELLRKDEGALSDLLRGAGYRPDLVTIQTGGTEAQQGGGLARGQGAAFAADGQPGGSTPDQPGRRAAPSREAAAAGGLEQGHEGTPVERDRGSLYL